MPEESAAEAAHRGIHSINPFKTREEFSRQSIISYKITTAVSWLLVAITSIYYSIEAPGGSSTHTIWGQNDAHQTAFTMNSIIASLYWIVLYLLQIAYCAHLYADNTIYVHAAAAVGPHFVINNLLLFGFIHLWVRSFFWIAELLLIANFFNLVFAYFRHPTTPRSIHIAVVSGPLAWNFVSLYWCGAAMVDATQPVARIVANVFIWDILVLGLFFLVVYKDYTMGIELSILAAAIGVAQFLTKLFALQWIFAFVNMGVLFVLSIAVAIPGLLGRDPFKRGEVVSEDQERAPLLAEN